MVIPQMQSWFALRNDLTVNIQDVGIMHQNLSFLTKLDDAALSTMLTTATSALPADKDFAGIVASIQNAAAVSGATLGDYSFQLGDLAGLDQNGKPSQLPVQLNIVLKGDITDAQRFAAQLKKQLPLSDAIAISVSANQSITVTVVFYYAQIPKIVFQDTRPLPLLSKTDQQLLNSLASGNNLQNAELSTPGASVSATPTPAVSLAPTPTIVISPSPTGTASAQ
ncbi:MAG TPA: hypothetical protein VLB73_04400 [Patescibacteria group bacterium]|nr:hypothetical protein [Patescibacteria group bacterium]